MGALPGDRTLDCSLGLPLPPFNLKAERPCSATHAIENPRPAGISFTFFFLSTLPENWANWALLGVSAPDFLTSWLCLLAVLPLPLGAVPFCSGSATIRYSFTVGFELEVSLALA